jgi:hypothetical protein
MRGNAVQSWAIATFSKLHLTFEKETYWAKMHYLAKNRCDLERDSVVSAWRAVEKIFHTQNDRLCRGFKENRTIVPLMAQWVPVAFRPRRQIHAMESFVSSDTDVRVPNPFGAQTRTSSSKVAKFISAQIVRLLISPSGSRPMASGGGAWRLLSPSEDSRPPLPEVVAQSDNRHHRDDNDIVDRGEAVVSYVPEG